jgi:SAP domain-containing protein
MTETTEEITEDQPVEEVDIIDQPIFSANLFWQGGATHTLRLDEINALRERQLKGESVMLGDTSARMLVEQLFKNAGFLMNRLAPRLIEVFARALIEEFGDNPTLALNPQHDHPTRTRQLRAWGVLAETEEPRDRGVVSGYDKPENPDVVNYSALTVPELQKVLREKNLPTQGYKNDLVKRLEEHDRNSDEVDTS